MTGHSAHPIHGTSPHRQASGRERPAPADPKVALSDFLQRRGLKRSRQRDAIVDAFFAMSGHVPIDRLVERVHQADGHVSVATVYRTMKLLAECGLAVQRRFDDGQTSYETSSRRRSDGHDHLICTLCGRIVEFESERVSALQLRLARRHGFEVERRRVELYGRCADCRGPASSGEKRS